MKLRSAVKSTRFAIALATAVSAAACSGVLGLTDPALDPTIGDGGHGDGAVVGDGQVGDGQSPRDSGSDAPSTCTANLTNDGANCGACGHSCQGGTCTGSKCDPVLVVDNAATLAPYDIVEDNGFFYFTNLNTSGLSSLAKIAVTAQNSAPPATILSDWSTHEGLPYQVAAGGGKVFFSVYSGSATNGNFAGGVVACTTTSCPNEVTVPNVDSYAVTTDGTNVVFGALYDDDAGNDHYGIRKSGLTLAPIAQIVTDLGDNANYLKIDGAKVYIASPSGVFTCPITGCGGNATTLNTLDAQELAVANGKVYFTSSPFSGTPTVQSLDSTTAPASLTQIASVVTNPLSIAADAEFIYFTDVGDTTDATTGKVVRCPVAGCGASDVNAVTISTGLAKGGNPRGFVNDATAIYWGSRTGKIWKLAK